MSTDETDDRFDSWEDGHHSILTEDDHRKPSPGNSLPPVRATIYRKIIFAHGEPEIEDGPDGYQTTERGDTMFRATYGGVAGDPPWEVSTIDKGAICFYSGPLPERFIGWKVIKQSSKGRCVFVKPLIRDPQPLLDHARRVMANEARPQDFCI